MKKLLFVRIPSICICFTLITLGNVILDLLCGRNVSLFLPVLFVWLAACQLIDQLFGYVDFKKWSHYCITESVVLYLLSLLVFRLFFWDGFSFSALISFTIIFLITDVCVFWYFYRRQQIQAEEINSLIDRPE